MKVTAIAFIIGSLLAGLGIGYLFNPVAGGDLEARPGSRNGAIRDGYDSPKVCELRSRIVELESRLRERAELKSKEPPKDNVYRPTPNPAYTGNGWGGTKTIKEWRERFPKEYAEMIEANARFAKEREEELRKQLGFLSSIDFSRMSSDLREKHNALIELIGKHEELIRKKDELLASDGNLTWEEYDEMLSGINEAAEQISECNSQERVILFEAILRNLGVDGADSLAAVEQLRDIIEHTNGRISLTGRPKRNK